MGMEDDGLDDVEEWEQSLPRGGYAYSRQRDHDTERSHPRKKVRSAVDD